MVVECASTFAFLSYFPKGNLRSIMPTVQYCSHVQCSIGMDTPAAEAPRFLASTDRMRYIVDGWISDGLKTVLSIVCSHSHVFDEMTASEEQAIPIAARSEWIPHVDFQDNCELIRQTSDHKLYFPLLEELAELAITLAKQTAQDVVVQTPHLTNFLIIKRNTWRLRLRLF